MPLYPFHNLVTQGPCRKHLQPVLYFWAGILLKMGGLWFFAFC